MDITLRAAVATFGSAAKAKLTNPAATGEPEDQLRPPFENLVQTLAQRPDYAITVDNALIGFIELKAPWQGRGPQTVQEPPR